MENFTLSRKGFLPILLLLLLPVMGLAQTYLSDDSYTVPAGVTSITIEAWGGGGKGGTRTTNGVSGGGGGGAYSRKTIAVTAGQTYNFTVGQGATTTANGTNTVVTLGAATIMTARGGNSVANNTATGAAGGTATGGDFNYSGGTGATGSSGSYSGGGGSSGGTGSVGGNGSNQNGGSATGAGDGGNGRTNSGNGSSGSWPGGGGGGAYRSGGGSTRTGGNGGNGRVTITVNAPEIRILGNSTAITDGDNSPTTADHTDFGSTDITSGSIVRTFTIENTGTATLTISSVGITGTHAADFSITSFPSGTVAAGGSTTFQVTFNPSAAGVRNAVVTVNNDDSNEAVYDFAIMGTGTISPEANIQGNGISIVDGDGTPSTADWTNFGGVEISVGTAPRTFTIYNTGSGTLTLGTITIGGTHASNFTITSSPAASVAPGGSTTFTITFNPSATGTRSATFSIVTNDSDENPYNFSIQGTGTSPEINVQGNFTNIVNGDGSASITDDTDFGTASIDAGSILVTFTIQNTGTGNLNLGSIYFTGVNAADFSVNIPPATVVASGSSTTVTISFNPTTVGNKVAYLYIPSDDANENPYYFQIIGLGVRTYPDTDVDNVSDNYDLDDDNDGIIDSTEQSQCILSPLSGSVTNTFLNETFGTGTVRGYINVNIPGASCTYCFEDGVASADYGTCTYQYLGSLNDGEYTVVDKIFDHGWTAPEDHTPSDTNGRMAVFNASYDPGTFYETTITGVMPNSPITYSFWVLNIMPQVNYPGSILPNITVEFLDTSNNVLSTYNTGDIGRCNGGTGVNTCVANEWQQYSTTVNLGAVTDFTIRFKNNAPGGGGNDLAIDDIVLRQQYCDRDGDGVADLFDLDSDNDGIPDIEEAGYKALSSGKSTMDRTLGSWADANSNGTADSIDAQIAASTYNIPDTDGDSVKDFHDLDSDNDAQFDVDEANLLNGDGDINGDGFGDGADTDLDGILNLYDNLVGYGTTARAYGDDTDSDGIANYREIDANTDGVKDILTTLYGSFDANLDGVIDGSADVDKDGILDTFDTNTARYGSPRDLNRKLFLDFDGRNDYGEGPQFLSSRASATIMGWIKLTAPFTSTGYVIGQDNFSIRVDMTDGTPKVILRGNGGVSATYNVALSANRWYHICGVYDGANATEKMKLYINGKLEVVQNSGALAGTLAASTGKFTFGRNPAAASGYFKGSIDEVRVFSTALTTDQIQKMVYQEIKQQGTAIRGEIIPKNIESTLWFNVLGYYRMDAYKDDVIDNYFTAGIDTPASATTARIYNHKVIAQQLAPMPFVTTQAGALSAAVSQNNFVFGDDIYNYDWSIIQVKHNSTAAFNLTGVGLIVDPSVTLVANNDNKVQNTWYMRLNGKLDLEGRSQLVQTATSDLDPLSSGSLERDQQGQTNRFNYNYWAMPVGAINATTNNNPQTVASLMKDGTNPASPQSLQWTTGLNSSATSPITLSSYWIFKFQNVSNSYANWSSVGPNGTLTAGQGFTMKGSNALTGTQNYTFQGKPNNGTITLPIAANNLNLCGNPYASAIDANAFITDNLSSLTGTLYFWEHFSTNNTHVLQNYQGGYATRTLVGGTPPVSPSGVSGLGSSTKTPGRFIPVGQGFFVTGSASGGTITFNNGQRTFVKESDVNSNTLFRQTAINPRQENILNNNEDVHEEGTFAKIRVGYNSSNNFHRQILLGFMDNLATPGMDPGYDARHIDSQPNDMYFVLGYEFLNIQGDGFFDTSKVYPLGVKNETAGHISFTLDGTENFDENQAIYIHDNETGLYHDIRQEAFELNMPAGTNNTRFKLTFTNGAAASRTSAIEEGIFVAYATANSTINIKNNMEDTTVKSVVLFNMLGQSILSWDVETRDQQHIQIPVKNLSTGTYIVKMITTNGDLSKKVIIK